MANQKRNKRSSAASAASSAAAQQPAIEQHTSASVAMADAPAPAETPAQLAETLVSPAVAPPAADAPAPVEMPAQLAETPASVEPPAADLSLNEAPTLTLPVFEPQPSQPAMVEPVAAAAPASPTEARSLSPAEERAVYARRRLIALGGIALALLLVALLAYRFVAPAPAQVAAPPAVGAPGAPAAPQAPPAEGAPAAPQSGVVNGSCESVAGLPVIAGATCVKQDRDEDDGQLQLENTYTVAAPADDVRRFYEGAFAQAGWRVDDTDHDAEDGQWEYALEQGDRDLKVTIEAQGSATELKIAEK